MNTSFRTLSTSQRTCSWKDIRKVRVYPRVRTVTLVMYCRNYMQGTQNSEYVGRVHIWDIWTLTKITVDSEHNDTHAPPKEDEEKKEREESDPMPAYGCQTLFA